MKLNDNKQAQIVIAADNRSSSRLVLIGVNARDRPGLLLDISKCLLRLNLQQHRTEAIVLEERSISVWRCTYMENEETDAEEISAVLSVSAETSLQCLDYSLVNDRLYFFQVILEDNSGVEVLKKRGLKVLRARVTKNSRLVDQTAVDVQFRETYKAAIVAVQQGGKNATQPLSTLTFGAGDVLVLQVSDDCPLLSPPVTATSRRLMSSLSVRSKSPMTVDVEVCKYFIICLFGERYVSLNL